MEIVSLDDLAPEGALAVIAPHPDDETLGCGGLIAIATEARRKVLVVLMTDGAASHLGSARWPPARLARLRLQETDAALGVLSGETISAVPLGLPDGRLETVDPPLVASTLQHLLRLHAVRTVFAPRWDDTHPDHRATYAAARTAAGAVGARLWCYPVWNRPDLDESAAVRLDIAVVRSLKRRAIRRHRSQVSRMIRHADPAFRLMASDINRFMTGVESFYGDRGD